MSSRAARWFVHSGIQEPSGGVARYYRTDLKRNQAISTEITGYAVSALLFLNRRDEALAAARFLLQQPTPVPFEVSPACFTYFFDCGIIARGLLAAWRATGEQEFLEAAAAVGSGMLADFRTTDSVYHPILQLPEKQPTAHDPLRWSQSPGCYQLKAGLAWRELFDATGEARFRDAYEGLLDYALRGYADFLPGHPDPLKVVDRLHAFLYFLEGLLPCAREEIAEGIRRVACIVEQAAPQFERSDVYAQLLRIRLFAGWMGIEPLDAAAAAHEASTLAGFQAASDDPAMDGGFYFGRKSGAWLPYVNPVSTAFAAQALSLWERRCAPICWQQLI